MNFLDTLVEFLSRFWPLAIVEQWERGVFYCLGRAYRRSLPPGLYPFVPWFMRIDGVSVVPSPITRRCLTLP